MCNYMNKKPTNYITLDVDCLASHKDQVENIVLDMKKCVDGKYQYFVRYYQGHNKPCGFKFVVNQCGKKIHQGSGTATKNPRDVPCVDITVKGGKVVKTDFKIKVEEVDMTQ